MVVFSVENLSKKKPELDGTVLFSGISFELVDKDIMAVKGPSGSGKTTFVKCLAELIPFESGLIKLDGKTPDSMGVPNWRSSVLYVPQRPAILPGSPRTFYTKVHSFSSNKTKQLADPIVIASEWGVAEELWDKEWNTLSGGESQRINMAIALSLSPTVLLLDEPTSALDPKTVVLVEKTITARLYQNICIWITHDPAQCERVSSKVLILTGIPGKFILEQDTLESVLVQSDFDQIVDSKAAISQAP